MTARLKGKVALLTAAGQGIGRATALAQLATAHPAIHTRVLDVRNDNANQELVAEIEAVDVLFNCAGYVHHDSIHDCTEKDWDCSFDINVKIDVPHLPRGIARYAEKQEKEILLIWRPVLPALRQRRTGLSTPLQKRQ